MTTVIDSTGLDARRRAQWCSLAQRHGVPAYAVLFDQPESVVHARNRARGSPVPPKVVSSQLQAAAGVAEQLGAERFAAVDRPGPVVLVGSDSERSFTGITYRNLAQRAKIVATLGVLSGGRAICGIGAAWYEREHRLYGWGFPPLAERYERLEDALELPPAGRDRAAIAATHFAPARVVGSLKISECVTPRPNFAVPDTRWCSGWVAGAMSSARSQRPSLRACTTEPTRSSVA